jgi:glutamate 5-kinase
MTKTQNQEVVNARKAVAKAKRVVIKLGTHIVMRDNRELAMGRLHGIIEELVALRRSGRQLILVSSGAVGLGAGRIGKAPQTLEEKQACAAVGQVLLMSVYEQAFTRCGVVVAQLLLTEHDFDNRSLYLNLSNTFRSLLAAGIVPIVNENDPVSTAEIETISHSRTIFGDNDKLSALLSSKIDAEALILLTNVDGLYAAPGPDKGGKLIEGVLAKEIGNQSDTGSKSIYGRGGMRAKLDAVRVAIDSGCPVVIANGTTPGTLGRIFEGESVGTVFVPNRKLSSRKRWIAFATKPVGEVVVTDGAREALEKRGASLLFRGVVEISGSFARGDVLSIRDTNREEFARGMSNHASEAACSLIGRHTSDVAEVSNESNGDTFITRDNLVLLKG